MDNQGFETPSFDAPIDVATYLDAVPDDAQIRGMYTDVLAKLARSRGHDIGRKSYVHFKYYPMREHIEVLADVAKIAFDEDLTLRESLRRLGGKAVPTLKGSMVGKVLSNLVGGTRDGAMSLVAKGYHVSRTVGRAKIIDVTEGHTVIGLRDVYDFPDAVHVGMFENGLKDIGISGDVEVRRISPFDVDIKVLRT